MEVAMLELKGVPVAKARKEVLIQKIEELASEGEVLGLAIVRIGDDRAAGMYASFLKKNAEAIGVQTTLFELGNDATQEEVNSLFDTLSNDNSIHGVLPLLPPPKHIDVEEMLTHLHYSKDIDGLTIHSKGLFWANKGGFVPATPRAVMAILHHYNIPVLDKKVVVIGRSQVVGKPVAALLLAEGAWISVCHSQTKNLVGFLQEADIVVSAVGIPHLVEGSMLKEGAVVLDVGINELNGETVGDVNYESALPYVSAITPVPGGVGSVTTTMILEALYSAYEARRNA